LVLRRQGVRQLGKRPEPASRSIPPHAFRIYYNKSALQTCVLAAEGAFESYIDRARGVALNLFAGRQQFPARQRMRLPLSS